MDGSCWLEVDDLAEPVRLDTGDLVLLMTGRGHRLRDAPTSEIEWLDDILARTPKQQSSLRYGGSGPRTELLCGGFMVEGAQASPLVLAMPPLLRLEGEDPTTVAWREALLEVLQIEVRQPRPGTDAVLARLADLLVLCGPIWLGDNSSIMKRVIERLYTCSTRPASTPTTAGSGGA